MGRRRDHCFKPKLEPYRERRRRISEIINSLMGPRWKEKGSEAIALAHPMSKIIAQLQSSLIQSETQGFLSGCDVLLDVGPEETGLLLRSSLGRPVITADKDKQWYQINLEEAFYMCHSLKCLNIVGENKCPKNNDELWEYIRSKRKTFPEFYKAYFHLRAKNWVVRSASQYGVDFVAYHHHPSLVHSEYAVLVLSESDGDLDTNVRLRVWSDIHGTVRLGDSVAKTLLILNIKKNGCDAVPPSCLDQYIVEERTITRWNPKQCQEDLTLVKSFKISTFSSSLSKVQSTVIVDFSVLSPGLSQVSTVSPSLKGPRWKGKGSKAIALAHPMSKIIAQLQSSLIQSETQGLLSGCDVLLDVGPEETGLLLCSSLGRPIVAADEGKQGYQINLEEAFYMCHSLKCLNIVGENKCQMNNDQLWEYMRSKRKSFPEFYKAYSHLRKKNWVVRSGSQYGVDYVAYRHHLSLVHSEYAVLVLSEGDDDLDTNVRLRVWSDIQNTVRLCGNVAKTLLILKIKKNGCDAVSPSCLDQYTVEEQTIIRWNPKQCREDQTLLKGGTC